MTRAFPRSFGFFLATGIVMLAQMIPVVGIFLMVALAMFWSVVLINLGMLGTAFEALAGRISHAWLLLPLAFYGGYYAFALSDQVMLARLRSENAASNALVRIPFDARRHVLVTASEAENGVEGGWLVQNFGLPVFFERNPNFPEGYRSTRMIGSDICAQVSQAPSLSGAGIHTFGFHDDVDGPIGRRLEKRFCTLTQPERPTFPAFIVSRSTIETQVGTLPVRRATTTITAPGGRAHMLSGGFASPLRWFPMPAMGCGLNSGAASWDCGAGFLRASFTPLLATGSRFGSDGWALAGALGLKRVALAERRGADPGAVLALVARAEADALAKDIVEFERVVRDPTAKIDSIPFRVLASRPDMLAPRYGAAMLGLERAAAALPRITRDNGRNLARLLTRLPPERFASLGPRIIALYASAEPDHWLWESDALVARLGDLGPDVLPLMVRPPDSGRPARLRSFEAACRLGPAARPLAPLLAAEWAKTRDFDRDDRTSLFVALRRIGLPVPALKEDKRGQGRKLAEEWADINPASPARVCAVRAEWQARREEKYDGKRRTNLT